MAVSFIGRGKPSIQRKPLTCRKSPTNSTIYCGIRYTWMGFKLTMLVAIGTDCIGSYKSNYHMITTTTAPETSVHHWPYKHSWLLIWPVAKISFFTYPFFHKIFRRESICNFLPKLFKKKIYELIFKDIDYFLLIHIQRISNKKRLKIIFL